MQSPAVIFDRVDRTITGTFASVGVPFLRISLGIVFFWFGILKFFPGLSSAEDLARRTIEVLTFGTVPVPIIVPALAALESFIGLGLIAGRGLRLVLLCLYLQMLGTFMPLLLFPAETFVSFPFVPTLEGQYIIKNLVLVGAGIVIGATVRGGQIIELPLAGNFPARSPNMGRP